ncbi:5-(carboxyamino)imidazole ribonucleotide synthase [Acetobacteraceae bacterium]|nr:5-(carboxyamino)imidazole ribonucleotide synthase [Candidatus Parcubacteria bacterium]
MPNGKVIAPGAVIGILGDGQLGKMIAMAAARLGYKVAVLGPIGRESPAGQVAYWAEAWGPNAQVEDEQFERFCSLVAVVLIEWENVPVGLLERIEARGIPVRPSSKVLAVAQDRLLEKKLARELDIGETMLLSIEKGYDLLNGRGDRTQDWPFETILKTRRAGYDGKGQARIPAGGSVGDAWTKLGNVPCILEQVVDFIGEVSVIVARREDGETAIYGPFQNTHRDGILRLTQYPISGGPMYDLRDSIREQGYAAARKLTEYLRVDGLLAVEFFVTKEGYVLFNEMAPRPHNSGHLTIECCDTSQFEQYVRAACNLPLGSTHCHSPGEMLNILGSEANDWLRRVGEDRLAVHLYGKGEAKPGRKMGHTTITAFAPNDE